MRSTMVLAIMGFILIALGGYAMISSVGSHQPPVIISNSTSVAAATSTQLVTYRGQTLNFAFLNNPSSTPQIIAAVKNALGNSSDPTTQVNLLASALLKIPNLTTPANAVFVAALILAQATYGTSLYSPVYNQIAQSQSAQIQQAAASMSISQQMATYGYVVHCVNYPVYDYTIPVPQYGVLVNGTKILLSKVTLIGTGTSPTYSGTILQPNGQPYQVTATLDTGLTCPGVKGSIVGSLQASAFYGITYSEILVILGISMVSISVIFPRERG